MKTVEYITNKHERYGTAMLAERNVTAHSARDWNGVERDAEAFRLVHSHSPKFWVVRKTDAGVSCSLLSGNLGNATCMGLGPNQPDSPTRKALATCRKYS
jgi:hypothetical protein